MNPIESHLRVKSLPSLCFNKDDFISHEFSVDRFVSNCRKYASLDTMRDDLTVYHKIVNTAMIELLNKDYADFVNLSSNLAGMEKSLNSLTLPLQSLRNEIDLTKTSLDETLTSATKMFDERASNHNSKVLIHHLLSVQEGLDEINLLNTEKNTDDLEVLERIAFTFNTVQFHMKKIVDYKDYAFKNEEVTKVAESLEKQLQNVFLQNLPKSGGLETNNTHDLHKILRIYSVISEERKVENIFRVFVVRPFMKNLISQNNIAKFGLGKVLNDILNWIPKACSDILKLTRGMNKGSEVVPGYDFLVNAVWPEIIDSFDYIAAVYLYSIGDPQQFHQNYTSTMKFLDEFEHLCAVQSSVLALRKLPSYNKFIHKFNLDVYFQIRFQEIAGKFESDLLEGFLKSNDADIPYILKATASLWTCMNLCWCDKIFLSFLQKDFLKLTMQLLSRYNKWAQFCIKETKDETLQLASLIKDVETLVPETKKIFQQTVFQKLSCQASYIEIEACVQEIIDVLHEIPSIAGKVVVKILSDKCSLHLKLISSIPQRFRKTNREIPSRPSPYVSQVLSPLSEFLLETNLVLPSEWCKYFQVEVTDEVMKQCVTLMRDVLTSIKKMEDSLKILKRARDKPTGQFSSGVITDDDKIRRQLSIDVSYFEELVLKSGFQVSDLQSFKELKELVTSAERVPGSSINS